MLLRDLFRPARVPGDLYAAGDEVRTVLRDGHQRLAFLVNKPDVPENGSTLIFDEELEGAMLEFYDATNGNTGTIIANRDGSGSIQWPDYNDGEKGCWDVHQFDVDCP